MKRLIFILLAFGFTLLSLGVGTLWIRSYWRADIFRRDRSGISQPQLTSINGRFWFDRGCARGEAGPVHWAHLTALPAELTVWPAPDFQFLGLQTSTVKEHAFRGRSIAVPDAAVLLISLLPACWCFWFAKDLKRSTWQGAGLCRQCGYDLRGITSRCPECGVAIDQEQIQRRWLSWAGGLIGALGMLGLGAMIWWSNPLRGAPPGDGANPQAGIDFYPAWEAARGDGVDRMRRRDEDWGITWYQSLWSTPEGERLVVITDAGTSMFLEYWRVRVLDREMRLVREGTVGLPSGTTPHRLLEVCNDAPGTPDVDPDRWMLSVEWPPEADGSDGWPGDSLNVIQWDNPHLLSQPNGGPPPRQIRDSALPLKKEKLTTDEHR